MPYIVETILGDRRIQLGNESFSRQMTIGTNWTKLRIGLRLSVNNTYSGVVKNVGFVVGFSQGASDWNTVTDFIGINVGPSFETSDWNLNGKGHTTGNYCVMRKTAAGAVQGSQPAGSNNVVLWTTNGHSQMGTTITKGNPATSSTYTFAQYVTNNTGADVARSDFILAMENEGTPTGCIDMGAATYAYTGNALFDSVLVRWNKSIPTLEISDLTVVRYY